MRWELVRAFASGVALVVVLVLAWPLVLVLAAVLAVVAVGRWLVRSDVPGRR